MDYSAANGSLWNPIIQIGIIAVFILFANVLRRKVKFVRTALMPTSVLAGFVLLVHNESGLYCNARKPDNNRCECFFGLFRV